MRKELVEIELIDKYLDKKLSKENRSLFEEKMANDTDFRQSVEDQISLRKGIERLALKAEAQKAYKKHKGGKGGMFTAIIILVLAIAASLYYLDMNHEGGFESDIMEAISPDETSIHPEDYLDGQVFHLSLEEGEVIETENNILFSIPTDAFVDKDGNVVRGPVEFTVKEAFGANDIMKAGLSTTSNGDLLETRGMFHMKATVNGEEVFINEDSPIVADIPNDNPVDGLKLWDGVNDGKGNINWVNPKQPENWLLPVDILGLDFYPPHYLDSLRANGKNVGDKKYTDSLYYSLMMRVVKPTPSLDSTSVIEEMYNYEEPENVFQFVQEEYSGSAKSEVAVAPFCNGGIPSSPEGELLFKQECSSCHQVKKGKLKLVSEQTVSHLPNVKNNDHMMRYGEGGSWFKQNSDQFTNESEMLAGLCFDFNTTFIGEFDHLEYQEWKKIFQFITYYKSHNCNHDHHWINPSTIKTIWNDKYQNTLLATNEFQSRLSAIHEYGSKEDIEVYISNLDQPMWYSDSIVARGNSHSAFQDFFKERQGSLENGNLKALKYLKQYYQKKQTFYNNSLQKIQDKHWKEFTKLKEEFKGKTIDKENRDIIRKALNFNDEYNLNLKEAYRQLGIKTEIKSFGWKNVDAYVMESTANRTSLDYTDPITGKTAKIEYKPLSVKVENESEMDRVNVYLNPTEISSFQRMKKDGEVYTEKMNELIQYNIIAVGFKGKEIYLNSHPYNQELSIEFNLELSSEKELKKLFPEKQKKKLRDLVKDVEYYQFEQEFKKKEAGYNAELAERFMALRGVTKHVGYFKGSDFVDREVKNFVSDVEKFSGE